MTYIELFDEDALENICSCLVNNPCRVVLLGDKHKLLEVHAKCYEEIMHNRGEKVSFSSKTVNKNSLEDIVRVLSQLVEEYDDCVFDLTGGGDLYLTAVGVLSQRYGYEKIKLQRFNPYTGTLYEFDEDFCETKKEAPISLSAEENIRLYGGDILHPELIWDMSKEFSEDINLMWSICNADQNEWNCYSAVFAGANKGSDESENPLRVTLRADKLREQLKEKYSAENRLLYKLCNAGLLTELDERKNGYIITYKNEQIKSCLSKAGQVLELKIYAEALAAENEDGSPVYSDIATGVNIEWQDNKDNTTSKNEIDVMLMHGAVPVFVSCKNGSFDANELYKLDVVAEKFGGKYAKKVIIAPGTDLTTKLGISIANRARDMRIRLITDINEQSNKKLISSLWRG